MSKEFEARPAAMLPSIATPAQGVAAEPARRAPGEAATTEPGRVRPDGTAMQTTPETARRPAMLGERAAELQEAAAESSRAAEISGTHSLHNPLPSRLLCRLSLNVVRAVCLGNTDDMACVCLGSQRRSCGVPVRTSLAGRRS